MGQWCCHSNIIFHYATKRTSTSDNTTPNASSPLTCDPFVGLGLLTFAVIVDIIIMMMITARTVYDVGITTVMVSF